MDDRSPDSILLVCLANVPTIEDIAPEKVLDVNLFTTPDGVIEPAKGFLPSFIIAPEGVIPPSAL